MVGLRLNHCGGNTHIKYETMYIVYLFTIYSVLQIRVIPIQ